MLCKKCGTALPHEGALFCPECGAKCTPDNFYSGYNNYTQPTQTEFAPAETKPKAKKKNKVKIILFSILGAIVALAITLTILFFTSPAYKVYSKYNAKEYLASTELYNAEVKGKFIQQMLLNMLLSGSVEETTEKYNTNEIDYSYASSQLIALESFGFKNAETELEKITADNNADESYKKADEYYKQGEYEKAIDEFSKIPEGNENYEDAQDMLEQVFSAYIGKTVEKVEQYNKAEQYKESVSLINTTMDVLPNEADTKDLKKALEESMAGYKTYISAKVAEFVEENNYADALDTIDDAIRFSDDNFFSELKTSTENNYVEYTTKTVEAYIKKNDFNSAIKVVTNALEELPDNKELKELKEHVEEETPTELSKLVVIDSHYYSYKNEAFTDSFGDDYDGYHWFESCEKTSYAIYNLNDKYTKFNCSVVASPSTVSGKTFTVAIYLDGKLAHTLKDFTKTTGKKDISLDVSNITKMEIKVSGGTSWLENNRIAIVNATVK